MADGIDRSAPIRWALLTLALAAAVGVSAYWTALASRPEPAEPEGSPPVPGLVPIGAGHSGAPRKAAVASRDRAYARGRRDGIREGRRAAVRSLRRRSARIYRRGGLAALGGFDSWSGAYVVTATRDGRGISSRVGPLTRGARYGLCRGGNRICVTRPD